jgi:hypothetical protein
VKCAKCSNTALPGSEHCSVHDHASAVRRGQKGGYARSEKYRAQRAEQAATLRVSCVADLQHMLLTAAKAAHEEGDFVAVISAVRAGNDLLKTSDHEQQLAELRADIERITGRPAA